MSKNQFKLTKEIINLSNNNNWEQAKSEWKLNYIERSEEPLTCLCGHYPINELCYMINSVNNNETIIGNVCVTKFLNIDSESLFSALRKIYKDNTKPISSELAKYALENELINNWEYSFSIDTKSKRKLTDNQLQKRIQINNKLIYKIRKQSSKT